MSGFLCRLVLIGVFLFSSAQAQVAAPEAATLTAFLPPEAAVKAALIGSPLLQAARAQKEGTRARAQGIDAGTAEFTLRGTTQQRRDASVGGSMHESMVTLERPLRVWGKRDIDANLATATRALAEVAYADALHESARELMSLWFVHLRALADKANAETTLALAVRMQRLTQSQLRQGEVSQRDADLAQAESERLRAAHELAQAQLASAAAALTRRYPGMALPASVPSALALQAPMALPSLQEGMDALRQTFLTKNHELNMMRLDAQRLRIAADRALRDRLPDPTVGVFSGRERAGAETVSGVMLSMPFPGASRDHQARAAVADAQAAADRVQLAEQRLGAQFEGTWAQFERKRAAADSLKSAAQRQALAADKSVKAYALGEGGLSEVLWIARVAGDNLLAAQRMQLDAVELWALLRLDLHQIWDFDE